MLNRRFIRENPQLVGKAARQKGESLDIEKFLKLDRRERELRSKVDELRHEQRLLSRQVSSPGAKGEATPSLRQMSQQVKEAKEELSGLESQLAEFLHSLPNIPDSSVPQGSEEKDNLQVREWGKKPEFDFTPLPHWELAKRLGIWDPEAGAKAAGSGFGLLKGAGSRLERALISFMLDFYTCRRDYVEISPPLLANRESLICTGHLPRWQQGMYHCEDDRLFLSPSGEVPLVNLHREEILDGKRLPLPYVACTPCFRRPESSGGSKSRQETRLHQFNSIELIRFVSPESCWSELDQLLTDAEAALQLLELPYRVMLDCVGQLSFASAKAYAIELWLPAAGDFLRVCSCRNYTDFQAQRGNIRFRRERDGRPEFVHTVGASGPAIPRLMAAVLENCQTTKGQVPISNALQRYMDGTVLSSSL